MYDFSTALLRSTKIGQEKTKLRVIIILIP